MDDLLFMTTDKKQKIDKDRPAFHIDDELIEAAKKAAEIFEKEEKEYAEITEK